MVEFSVSRWGVGVPAIDTADNDMQIYLTHWPWEMYVALILEVQFSNSLHRMIACLVHSLWSCFHLNATGPNGDKSTFVQVMAWCLTAPSHYMSKCWPRTVHPYGVISYTELKATLHFMHWVVSYIPSQLSWLHDWKSFCSIYFCSSLIS